MKTMLRADFSVIRPYLLQQTVMGVLVAVFISIGLTNFYIIAPMVIGLSSFALIFTLISLDESNNWERYRLSLPLSRAQIIRGRYLSCVLLVLTYAVIGVVTAAIIPQIAMLVSSVVPNVNITAAAQEVTLEIMLVSTSFVVAFMFVVTALILPLTSRFGMTKAVRFMPLLIAAVVVGAVMLLSTIDTSQMTGWIAELLTFIVSPAGMATIVVGFAALAVAVLLISMVVATKLYQKRQF